MIAAAPGPALHMALLGAVVVIALVVYAIVRVRRRHEAAEAERLDRLDESSADVSADAQRGATTYALLAYDPSGALDELPAAEKRHLHRSHRDAGARPGVRPLAHYRFRPPRLVTTVGAVDGAVRTSTGPANEASAGLRALYIVESTDPDAVVAFAGELPAVPVGGTVEIWPLTEPRGTRSHVSPERARQVRDGIEYAPGP